MFLTNKEMFLKIKKLNKGYCWRLSLKKNVFVENVRFTSLQLTTEI